MDYLNFDLLVDRATTGYRIQVLDSPAGQAAATVDLAVGDLNFETFLEDIGRPNRGLGGESARTHPLDRQAGDTVREFGRRLYDFLFAGQVSNALDRSLDEARRQRQGLRLRLRLGDDVPELRELPWEYVYAPDLGYHVAARVKSPLVRYLQVARTAEPLAVAPPLRILAVIPDPVDQPELDAGREWGNLEQALAGLRDEGQVTLERLAPATVPALQDRLRQGDTHVLHYSGHGHFQTLNQEGVLYLEDDRQHGRAVGSEELRTLLGDEQDTLRLVVLNACKGARTSLIDPFAGLAQGLVQEGIPAVIGMQFAITDVAGLTFSRTFYKALADGLPVDASLGEARKAIFTEGNRVEWGIPVLFMRAADGRIFQVQGQGTDKGRGGEARAGDAEQAPAGGGVNIRFGNVKGSQVTFGDVAGGDIVKGRSEDRG